MKKFMIIDNDGNILRTISLPYEGSLINITDMPDEEWQGWYHRLTDIYVDMESPGIYKIDERGLPIIKDR